MQLRRVDQELISIQSASRLTPRFHQFVPRNHPPSFLRKRDHKERRQVGGRVITMNSISVELIWMLVCAVMLVLFWRVVLVLFLFAMIGATLLGLATAVSYFGH
jgi:hypothetical protein